ncbi:flagellar filament capping protein FliD [Bacillaceae bacterium Marseille-Q3522]|nr:flagellar filament capping protein FliD [Bacillaceae bacterium Marseille-Q3522]
MARIAGLASGMDIEQMVTDLMKAERIPLNKLKQEKQILEWQRDDYRTMNIALLEFRSLITQMKLSTNYRARMAVSSDNSKVDVSATSAASLSSTTISNVEKLAKAETWISGSRVGGSSFDPAESLYGQTDPSDLPISWKTGAIKSTTIQVEESGLQFSIGDSGITDIPSWSVKVNGKGYEVITSGSPGDNQVLVDGNGNMTFNKEIAKDSTIKVEYIADKRTDKLTLNYKTSSWQLAQGAVNSISSIKLTKKMPDDTTTETFLTIDADGITLKDGTGTVIGTIDKSAGKITFNNNMPLPTEDTEEVWTLEATYDHHYTSFDLSTFTSKGQQYESFLVSGSQSLNSVIDKVNGSNVGVTMFYDTYTGKMSMTRTETGVFNSAGNEISFDDSFIKDILGFNGSPSSAQNAVLTINGLQTERTSNTFEMNGVTYTLKQTFTDTVTTSISNDTQTVFDNIKNFVTKYNELIDKIQDESNEERFRDYKPLTDEEREQLSDKQQEQWEEKARSGLLRHDPILSGVLSSMRSDFYTPVANDNVATAFNQLAKIGIKTTANYLEGGKLEIDEAALKKAIEEDPASVENLFRGTGTTSSQKGILTRLYDSVSDTMDQLADKAGNSYSTNHTFLIGRQLLDLDDRITSFEDRMKQVEDRYWRQFTAMEQAIQRSNSQYNYLMQQFSMQ